jgi:hypothetical protein
MQPKVECTHRGVRRFEPVPEHRQRESEFDAPQLKSDRRGLGSSDRGLLPSLSRSGACRTGAKSSHRESVARHHDVPPSN